AEEAILRAAVLFCAAGSWPAQTVERFALSNTYMFIHICVRICNLVCGGCSVIYEARRWARRDRRSQVNTPCGDAGGWTALPLGKAVDNREIANQRFLHPFYETSVRHHLRNQARSRRSRRSADHST